MRFVVRVELCIVAATRYGYVSQPAIHQFFSRLLSVHMHKHTVGCLTLAAVTRHRVTVIEMRMFLHIERNAAPGVNAELYVSARVHLFDSSQLAIRNVLLFVRR